MSLLNFLNLYKKHLVSIVLAGIAGGAFGLIFFLSTSPTYIASGSFYVSRSLEVTPLDFKYEGYYSSLSSLNFAKSLAVLIESDDVKKQVLQALHQPVTRQSLKRLDKATLVKKPETQLVTLQTKATSAAQAQQLWMHYKDILISSVATLNKNGDSNIVVASLVSTPTTFQTFRSLPLNIAIGVFVGIFVSMFLYGAYYFAREGNKNETV